MSNPNFRVIAAALLLASSYLPLCADDGNNNPYGSLNELPNEDSYYNNGGEDQNYNNDPVDPYAGEYGYPAGGDPYGARGRGRR